MVKSYGESCRFRRNATDAGRIGAGGLSLQQADYRVHTGEG